MKMYRNLQRGAFIRVINFTRAKKKQRHGDEDDLISLSDKFSKAININKRKKQDVDSTLLIAPNPASQQFYYALRWWIQGRNVGNMILGRVEIQFTLFGALGRGVIDNIV